MRWEVDVGVLSCHNIVSAKSGQAFYDYAVYFAVLNVIQHTLKIRSFKVRTAVTVIHILVINAESVFSAILGKHLPLSRDTSAFALKLVDTAES